MQETPDKDVGVLDEKEGHHVEPEEEGEEGVPPTVMDHKGRLEHSVRGVPPFERTSEVSMLDFPSSLVEQYPVTLGYFVVFHQVPSDRGEPRRSGGFLRDPRVLTAPPTRNPSQPRVDERLLPVYEIKQRGL